MKNQTQQRPPSTWSLIHWSLLTTLVLGVGALTAYVITRESMVLFWTTGTLGTTFGAIAAGSAYNKNQREPPPPLP